MAKSNEKRLSTAGPKYPQPEQRGIWLTIIRAHLTLGALGLLAGAALFAALWTTGNPAVRATPGMGLVALAGFGLTFGLIIGGLLSLRSDQGRLIRRGLKRGHWVVVAHPADSAQIQQTMQSLTVGSLPVMRSF